MGREAPPEGAGRWWRRAPGLAEFGSLGLGRLLVDSEQVGGRGRLPPWHREFPGRPLGHVRVSAGLWWCPGLVWLMPQAQEVEQITCGPLRGIEPRVVTRRPLLGE